MASLQIVAAFIAFVAQVYQSLVHSVPRIVALITMHANRVCACKSRQACLCWFYAAQTVFLCSCLNCFFSMGEESGQPIPNHLNMQIILSFQFFDNEGHDP